MGQQTRRRLLRTIGGVAAGTVAGCIGSPTGSAPGNQTTTGTESSKTPTETTDDGSLTDWERSTSCEGSPDDMHDSIIRVEQVTERIGDEYAPIRFSELTSEEQDILRTVTREGGYDTCDVSDAFDRFIDRVSDRQRRQDKDGVYLKREDTYYRLYVEKLDQVYAH